MFLASCPPLPAETAVILAAENGSLLLPTATRTFEEGVWLENQRERNDRGARQGVIRQKSVAMLYQCFQVEGHN